jgi:hypothetical protein
MVTEPHVSLVTEMLKLRLRLRLRDAHAAREAQA